MTNDEILNIVYHEYKMKSLIKKMIKNSGIDNSYQDLEQQIYIILFLMDNNKLNYLYETNGLIKWISTIIRNNRNYYKNDYQSCRLFDNREPTDDEIPSFEHNYLLDWLDYELNKYDWNDVLTKEEINIAGEYEILKFYMNSGYSMSKIAKYFGVSSMKINNMIKSAKQNIKYSYDRGNYDIWYENKMKIYD